jgi:hypothetical protein
VLEISEKKDVEIYIYEVPKCWVQCRGLPKEIREFPITWAVGTIIGATREVDMKFTKTFGRARLKVAALMPERIPELVDVVIGDYMFSSFNYWWRLSRNQKILVPLMWMNSLRMEAAKSRKNKDSENKSGGKSKDVANSGQTPLPPATQALGSSALQRKAPSSPRLGHSSAPA